MQEIAIYPTQAYLLNNKMFCADEDPDHRMAGFIELKETLAQEDITLQTFDRSDLDQVTAAIFYQVENQMALILALLRRNPTCRILVFAIEPPVVCGMHEADILTRIDVDGIFTWRDDLSDKCRIIKANDPRPHYEGFVATPFAERNLICTIAGNKSFRHANALYEARKSTIRAFQDCGIDFDLYGTGWQSSDDRAIKKAWKGAIDDKRSVQSKYKFTLCFENAQGYPGYVTEKIFDCFVAGSIPIYWGASNIQEIIPSCCFIDWRDFQTVNDLAAYLQTIDENRFQGYQKAADQFMRTRFALDFSGSALAHKVAAHLKTLAQEPARPRSPTGFVFQTIWTLLRSIIFGPTSRKLASLYHLVQAFHRHDR